eukprot:5318145-Alexandrium_andersonii.AAC.1
MALEDFGVTGSEEAGRRLAVWLEQHATARDPRALPLWPATLLAWAMEVAGIAEMRAVSQARYLSLLAQSGFVQTALRQRPGRAWQAGR